MGYYDSFNNLAANPLRTWCAGCLLMIVFTAIWVVFTAWIGSLIWNDVVVGKFGAPPVDYIDMLLLMILARLFMPVNINSSGKQ